MSQVDDLNQSVQTLTTAAQDAKTRVTAAIGTLNQEVTALEARVSGLNPPVELGPIKQALDGLRGTVDSIDASPTEPAPAPVGGQAPVIQPDPGQAPALAPGGAGQPSGPGSPDPSQPATGGAGTTVEPGTAAPPPSTA